MPADPLMEDIPGGEPEARLEKRDDPGGEQRQPDHEHEAAKEQAAAHAWCVAHRHRHTRRRRPGGLAVADWVRLERLLRAGAAGSRGRRRRRAPGRSRRARTRRCSRAAVGNPLAADGAGEQRRDGGAAEAAADGARDRVHARRDAGLLRPDVLDDQVRHRRERETDAAAEQRRGDVDLPALVARDGEQQRTTRPSAGRAGEQRRLRAEELLQPAGLRADDRASRSSSGRGRAPPASRTRRSRSRHASASRRTAAAG